LGGPKIIDRLLLLLLLILDIPESDDVRTKDDELVKAFVVDVTETRTATIAMIV